MGVTLISIASALFVGLLLAHAAAGVIPGAPRSSPSTSGVLVAFAPSAGIAPPTGSGSNHTAVLNAIQNVSRVGSVTAFELNISNAVCSAQTPSPAQYVNEIDFYFGNGAVIREPGEASGSSCSGASPYELMPFTIAYQNAGAVVVNATVIFLNGEVVVSNAVTITVQPAAPSAVPGTSLADLADGGLVLVLLGAIAASFRWFVAPPSMSDSAPQISERRERLRSARGPATGLAGLAMMLTGVYLCTQTIHDLSTQLLTEIWASGNPTPVTPTTTFLPVAALGLAAIVTGGMFLVASVVERESAREALVESPRLRRRGWAIGAVLILVVALLAASSVLITVPVAHPFSTTIADEPLCPLTASSVPLATFTVPAPHGALIVYAWQTAGQQSLGNFAILPGSTPMSSAWSSNWDSRDSSGYGWFNVSTSPVTFGVCSPGPTASGASSSLTVTGYYYSPWL